MSPNLEAIEARRGGKTGYDIRQLAKLPLELAAAFGQAIG
jgi:hypothetical protein